jgi:hypothetical protein
MAGLRGLDRLRVVLDELEATSDQQLRDTSLLRTMFLGEMNGGRASLLDSPPEADDETVSKRRWAKGWRRLEAIISRTATKSKIFSLLVLPAGLFSKIHSKSTNPDWINN